MQPGLVSIKRLCLSVFALGLLATASGQTMQQRLLEALDKTPHPNSAADFQSAASLPCLNQGKTLVCWSFATCSFLESEMARLKLPPVRLESRGADWEVGELGRNGQKEAEMRGF